MASDEAPPAVSPDPLLLLLPCDIILRHVFVLFLPDEIENILSVCRSFADLAPGMWKMKLEGITASAGLAEEVHAENRSAAQWKRSYRTEYYKVRRAEQIGALDRNGYFE
uniref:F-box domain-containing protein n=1 Tax=Odontella aurita TaxID=265563 RepID=A0A7S4KCV6_9STRA|mmetsp:Transcript_9584/g.28756  ORF Transcript_9584/g.28756 Transcript_9584/m.28756 type:complete len:110 (+) Transcript_9584:135-464(+)